MSEVYHIVEVFILSQHDFDGGQVLGVYKTGYLAEEAWSREKNYDKRIPWKLSDTTEGSEAWSTVALDHAYIEIRKYKVR